MHNRISFPINRSNKFNTDIILKYLIVPTSKHKIKLNNANYIISRASMELKSGNEPTSCKPARVLHLYFIVLVTIINNARTTFSGKKKK